MYTKQITQRIEISRIEAESLLVEAKVIAPQQLAVYESCLGVSRSYLSRVFTLQVHKDMFLLPPESLLEYARKNMPDNIRFDR
jgi:hypothetical protein